MLNNVGWYIVYTKMLSPMIFSVKHKLNGMVQGSATIGVTHTKRLDDSWCEVRYIK